MKSTFFSAFKNIAPWLITLVALYFVSRDIDWQVLRSHIGEAQPLLILMALIFTVCSYLLRARRWQKLFPSLDNSPGLAPNFIDSFRVLILGFFMNNILPARAGELVRAHLGGIVTKHKRTLVLATVASERLLDGLTLSAFFVLFALGLGSSKFSTSILLVSAVFALACLSVAFVVSKQSRILGIVEKLSSRASEKVAVFTNTKAQQFLTGLSPLTSKDKIAYLGLSSIAVWLIELSVYYWISWAFNAELSFAACVLFMVSVNFSSLIPAAPGGIGVIEAIATGVLVSIGVPKELALTMVVVQHLIQYLVVGIPGAVLLLTWKSFSLKRIHSENE